MNKFRPLVTDYFLADIARSLNMRLTKVQGDAIRLICQNCDEHGLEDERQVAYILGTCYHECLFKSIKEYRAAKGSTVWKMQEVYWKTGYYGRGYCQLTWLYNYKKFSPIVGMDLVKSPDLVLLPEVGAKILVMGMLKGMFSGRRLGAYFPEDRTKPANWLHARRTVNGNFRAEMVERAAKKILAVIEKYLAKATQLPTA